RSPGMPPCSASARPAGPRGRRRRSSYRISWHGLSGLSAPAPENRLRPLTAIVSSCSMTKRPVSPEWTRYGVARSHGVQLLHAHYVHHSYERHAHDVYALGVTEAGVQSFSYRRSFYASTTGTTLLLLPSEMHDGRAGAPEGFTYRMLYIEPSVVRDMIEDATERASPLPVTGIPLI